MIHKFEGGLRTKNLINKSNEYKPLISIITVVFNSEKMLEVTIKSVISQTYDNVEYVIVDGGSTDGTLDVIKKYEDRIDYWVSEKDSGIYDAMNKGLDLISGDWINFMNAGDSFSRFDALEIFSTHFNKDFSIVHSDVFIKNNITLQLHEKKQPTIKTWYGNYKMICHQSILFNSKYIEKYNLVYEMCADMDLLVYLYKKRRDFTIYIDKPLVIYLDGGVSIGNIIKTIKEGRSIIYKYEKFLFKIIGTLNYFRLRIKYSK